ncbi:tripartite tricarboxylate transporter substrate binding protein [Micromonospora sp. NPDC049559]|uniref:Bug family tripartite tricarboxylate transporter substrate binding protein n=1 Tax=Micromonospora sp. NPDC049559 TaxID=3155923 RepID=UPI0034121E4C
MRRSPRPGRAPGPARRRVPVAAGLALLLAAVAGGGTMAGCAAGHDPAGPAELRIMVPNAPGSGYDVTARTAAKALEDAGVIRGVEVFNLPGGGGLVGLRRLGYERGNARLTMLMGLGVVGSQYATPAPVTLQDTTPVARLIEEPAIVVVTRDSPYRELADLVAAWRSRPAAVPVGGGSAAGGPDYLAPMLLAEAVGIAPSKVAYREYDGGGDLLAAILGKQVAFGVSGLSEYADQITSGQLRVLAVTSARRIPGVPAPTLRESGVDVVFANWRGIVAPPGLAAPDAAALRSAVRRLHDSPQWRAALAKYGWTDAYLDGDAFGVFLRTENARLAGVLAQLGLTVPPGDGPAPGSTAAAPGDGPPGNDRPVRPTVPPGPGPG